MSNAPHHLDAVFIESKRRELTQLRDALRKTASASQLEEDGVRDASAEQPREFEDDAQKLDTLEKEGVLINRTAERLARVDENRGGNLRIVRCQRRTYPQRAAERRAGCHQYVTRARGQRARWLRRTRCEGQRLGHIRASTPSCR